MHHFLTHSDDLNDAHCIECKNPGQRVDEILDFLDTGHTLRTQGVGMGQQHIDCVAMDDDDLLVSHVKALRRIRARHA